MADTMIPKTGFFFMITITKKGTSVMIEVQSKYPLNRSYLFYWECGREDFALLLRDNLQGKMNDALEKIRQDAYMKGWKDAKARAKKETWFSGWW